MKTADLDFSYPPELLATEPLRPSRVLFSDKAARPVEISVAALLEKIPSGDLLVVNDTKVLPVRVWSVKGDEVLFVRRHADFQWDVLFLARDYKLNDELEFPGGVWARLTSKGLPQRLTFDQELSAKFFTQFGEPALPPYIQAARGDRHARAQDRDWYQTAWAEKAGSSAAPTASLHFTLDHLRQLRARGVRVAPLTLHVGLGTFLPIKTEDLSQHEMHGEDVFLPQDTIAALKNAQRVWALGTTVTRALEAWGQGQLAENESGFHGETKLFITPGYEFQTVHRLLTNFHQPRSTLLALVMAFAGEERVREAYAHAIENKFRLFSYGDLSAWM